MPPVPRDLFAELFPLRNGSSRPERAHKLIRGRSPGRAVGIERADVARGVVAVPGEVDGRRAAQRGGGRAGRHPGRPRGSRRGPARSRGDVALAPASLAPPRHARRGRRAAGGRSPLGDPSGRPRRRGGGRTGLPARGRRRARALRRAAAAGRHRRRDRTPWATTAAASVRTFCSAASKDSPSGHGRASCSTSARRSSASSISASAAS